MKKERVILRRSGLLVLAVMALGLSACSTAGTERHAGEIYDPFEPVNRTVFAVNDAMDQTVAEPVARGYRSAVPSGLRIGLRNVLRHLTSPVVLANEILQGDTEGAKTVLFRTVVNTFAGFGGLVDVASWEGIEHEGEDFGQTLAVWGVDHGPYLVLPFFGSSSARDASGMMVDTLADPVRLYLFNTDRENLYYIRAGAGALDKREALLDPLEDLRRNSFDYYAAVRSAYYQRRQALVYDENTDMMAGPAIPDYDDME